MIICATRVLGLRIALHACVVVHETRFAHAYVGELFYGFRGISSLEDVAKREI